MHIIRSYQGQNQYQIDRSYSRIFIIPQKCTRLQYHNQLIMLNWIVKHYKNHQEYNINQISVSLEFFGIEEEEKNNSMEPKSSTTPDFVCLHIIGKYFVSSSKLQVHIIKCSLLSVALQLNFL